MNRILFVLKQITGRRFLTCVEIINPDPDIDWTVGKTESRRGQSQRVDLRTLFRSLFETTRET